tara:strand:+ start:1338 stop:1754 length:417 start_codon:yes stop_codon:yes gene_type:complete
MKMPPKNDQDLEKVASDIKTAIEDSDDINVVESPPPIEENNLYRTSKDKNGDVIFELALPNDDITGWLMGNKKIVTEHPEAIQRIINMEWKYISRRIIRWLGDSPAHRQFKEAIDAHIKNEKKFQRVYAHKQYGEVKQ